MVKIPYKAKVKLSRKALMDRDNGLCGYCGKTGQNIDHIIPRSRGGKHVWENVVFSCIPCNDKKANHLLSEIGMKLLVKPYQPKDRLELVIAVGKTERAPEWEPYLSVA